jgi:transposase
MAYSKEFRGEVFAAYDAKRGTRQIALQFKVSESWVRRIVQERREQGKVGPATRRRRVPKWMAHRDAIIAATAKHPDQTLEELQAELNTELSTSTLCRALRRLRLTLKKSLKGDRAASSRRARAARRLARSPGGPRP